MVNKDCGRGGRRHWACWSRRPNGHVGAPTSTSPSFNPNLAADTNWTSKAIAFAQTSLLPSLEAEKTNGKSHDVGFTVFLPYSVAMRVIPANAAKYHDIAATLASRFDERVGLVKSWDNNTFPVITDTLINLELLLWAGKEKPNPKWTDIANRHFTKTMSDFVLDTSDSACMWHRVSYKSTGAVDTKSGLPQGYSDTSSIRTRGMAWTIYGYMLIY